MSFDQLAKRKAAGSGVIRPLTDVSLAIVLLLFLVMLIKPSAAEPLDLPIKLFVGVTALLLLVRAATWRSPQ